jgi:NAD(P)-dependent dehydrogenase (short-subunit alcohol dehydrogenase family)
VKIDLSGKTAVVSGSTAGIGLAIATGLAAAGADTVINGRRQDAVDRAIDTIAKAVAQAKLRGSSGCSVPAISSAPPTMTGSATSRSM